MSLVGRFPRLRCPDRRVCRPRCANEDPQPKRDEQSFGLDEFDPVRLGRKSRQAFDELWSQFATLASPTRSFNENDFYQDAVFRVDPEARNTKVLVVGAAGRTGRTIVRKLLLRGYRVRALIMNERLMQDLIPTRVEVVVGDITDPEVCREAVEGIDKVVFAAASRSLDPEAYRSVFEHGLKNLLHAFMDYKWVKSKNPNPGNKKMVADFKKREVMDAWNAQVIGRVSRAEGETERPLPPGRERSGVKEWSAGRASFSVKNTENGNLKFRGAVYDIGSAAEIGGPVQRDRLSDSEGIVVRLRGDGNLYAIVCTMDDGQKYAARFVTKWGYSTIRIPFTLFRPDWGGSDTLDGTRIINVGLRFENTGRPVTSFDGSFEQPLGRFNVELDWIKTLPAGKSTDFVLVSCAGVPREGVELSTLQEILVAKRVGEAMLRNSGVAYTVVRPTTLIDEPGGLKALVFDQGDRLSESISAVDVADVCVRSLLQPLAGNKTFEVAHEATSSDEEDEEVYELVAHVPDKSTNYLGAALANLEKNT